ncbi:MAG TPA: class I SAM-dependent methyltransferase [Terriglobia bacterium]|nr:class I SAM-dependent methyltransferase [Terriglobia bacterium]
MRHLTAEQSGRRRTIFDLRCSGDVSAALVFVGLFLTGGCSQAQNSGPERDRWQRPDEVMNALGVTPGSFVADVGCGRGYFTMKLAARVGPTGKVYAVDIKDEVLADVRREAREQGLKQVTAVLGAADDPHLPPHSLDVVLSVDSYHEWVDYDSMLDHLYAALKPGGLLGLIDGETKPGKSRDDYHSMHRMPESMEREDLARHDFHFLRSEPGFTRPSDGKTYYFLIFQK